MPESATRPDTAPSATQLAQRVAELEHEVVELLTGGAGDFRRGRVGVLLDDVLDVRTGARPATGGGHDRGERDDRRGGDGTARETRAETVHRFPFEAGGACLLTIPEWTTCLSPGRGPRALPRKLFNNFIQLHKYVALAGHLQ